MTYKLKSVIINTMTCSRTKGAVTIISITIKEIAAMAVVSRGTVDRVIHSIPGVSQENIDKVNKIINEYGFKPNSLVKALATK